jgi:hypothetical protein
MKQTSTRKTVQVSEWLGAQRSRSGVIFHNGEKFTGARVTKWSKGSGAKEVELSTFTGCVGAIEPVLRIVPAEELIEYTP